MFTYRTYGRTDIRTDKPSYRDAWTHLKTTTRKKLPKKLQICKKFPKKGEKPKLLRFFSTARAALLVPFRLWLITSDYVNPPVNTTVHAAVSWFIYSSDTAVYSSKYSQTKIIRNPHILGYESRLNVQRFPSSFFNKFALWHDNHGRRNSKIVFLAWVPLRASREVM